MIFAIFSDDFFFEFPVRTGSGKNPCPAGKYHFQNGFTRILSIFHGYDFMAGQGYPAGSGRLEPDLVSVPFANPCAQVTKLVACGKFLAFAGGTL